MNLEQRLKQWRNQRSRKMGVEVFRIIPNRTLDEIVKRLPGTKEELLRIHGIGERKVSMYGEEILEMTRESLLGSESVDRVSEIETQDSKLEIQSSEYESQDLSQQVVSVGEFLDRANAVLSEMPGAVRGEVSSADIRDRYVFFTIKDSKDNALLSIFMWRSQYDICGVSAEAGVEVVVRGHLDIYKPSGRLSFHADSMELIGEGAIKAAYDRLKRQLESEGLFALERKRQLKEFPRRIGLITSKEGAVIHDFMSNIGKFGFHITFMNSRVEGALAVTELLRALRILKTYPIDVLVVIRGGGSLESLAAFNNEAVVREIAHFPTPVICGIGHDQDVPLASLVADIAVSTPTATTRELGKTWESLVSRTDTCEREIMYCFERLLEKNTRAIEAMHEVILRFFANITERYRVAEENMRGCILKVSYSLIEQRNIVDTKCRLLVGSFASCLVLADSILITSGRSIRNNDPRRQLRLGYSIARVGEKVVRSIGDVRAGELLFISVSDGKIETNVGKTHKRINEGAFE